jgi:methylated-DNA-protein-cysteine methyltransferase-like protein
MKGVSLDPSEAVFAIVRQVPKGRVVTYGQIAGLVEGVSLSPREVGAIMFSCPAEVPWQRVVGAGGHLPIGKRNPVLKMRQRELLETEGVTFLPNDCVDMSSFQWTSEEISSVEPHD